MLQIESWDINKPIPYARNARKISQKAIDKVASSIQEFGWQQPLVVDSSNVVIAGHTRLLAAQKLGLKEVPVHVADGLTDGQVKAYRLMDNRSHEEAKWDFEFLVPEMSDLRALCVDLSLTGFDIPEIDELFAKAEASAGLTDPDVCPDTPETPVTVPGDLWLLGRHRLLCGDSTSVDAVERLMEGEKAHIVFTDPPYGIKFQSGMSKRFDQIMNDDRILEIASVVIAYLRDDAAAYIWTAQKVYTEWKNQFSDIYKSTIIWHKPGSGMGDLHGDYAPDYEMCLFCVNGSPKFRDKRGMAVWKVSKDQAIKYKHPTQKPVELAERALLDFSDAGNLVLDLFGGSGSTLIAAERMGRKARILELDPKYVDVIVKRWQDFTGLKAINQETGEEFRS